MSTTTPATNPVIPRIAFPSSRPISKVDLALLGPNADVIQAERRRTYRYSRRVCETAHRRADIARVGKIVNAISDTESWHVVQVKQLNQFLGEMQRNISNARIETNECERKIVELQRGLDGVGAPRFIVMFRETMWKGQRERGEEEIAKLRGHMKRVQERVMEMDREYEDHRVAIWDEIEHRWKGLVDNLRLQIMPQMSAAIEMAFNPIP